MTTLSVYQIGTTLLNRTLSHTYAWLMVLSLAFILPLSAQVITVAYTGGALSTPPTNGVGGNSAVTFTVQNTNATAVNLLEVSVYTNTTYNNSVYTLWYSATSLGGAPGPITSPTWTQVATSGLVPVTALGNVLVLQNLSLLIPASTTYRFALQSSLGIVYAGSTASPASPNTFSSGGITVSTGNVTNGGNVGYGGAFPSPGNNPRSFVGVLNFGVPTPCSGTPTATTISSLASVCPVQTFNLSLSGLAGVGGLTYQWQSSANGTTYTPITGATSASYSTTQSVATWYQCNVTCTNSSLSALSTPVQVNMNSFTSCYCNSAATSTIDDDIGRVTFGTLANPAAAPSPLLNNSSSTATYTNFTSLAPVSYFKGVSYPISVQQINSGIFFSCFTKVFIDYNQNGVLTDPGEAVFAAGPTVNSGSGANLLSGSVLIPLTALSGTTLMRVVLRESGTTTTTTPCGTYPWGETEDYLINIVSPSGCIGATAGITTSSLPSVCPTQTFTLAIPNTVVASNIVYQWQDSPNNSTWTNIAAGTSINYSTTQSAATWYRCIVTCTTASVSDTSIAVQVQMNSYLTCYCNSTSTSTADEDIFAVTVNGISNLSTCTSVGPGPGSVQNKYSNYTTISPFSGALGATVPFSVQIGTCGGNYFNAVKIFIDFNQNGSLSDPGETVYASAAATNGPHTESGSFVIPSTALTGNLLMRVVNVETSNISSITPCNTYTWGETEDYLINVAAPIPFNGQVSAIYSPSTGCGLSNCEDISFGVRNVGTSALTSIPYSYSVNGGTPILATFTPGLPIPAGDSASLVIACGVNLSTPGTYTIQVTVLIPGDTDPILDSQTKTVISIPTITTFPYLQGFDSPVNPAGGWETGTGAAAGTWALGTPAKSVINSPASAPNAWVTGGLTTGIYNNNEKSWVQSPCLDLSAMVLPVLELSVWWDAEFSWDGMIVQSSVDGGATWQNVGTMGTGINWYNDGSVSGMTGLGTNQEAWTGSAANGSGGWRTAKQSIPSLAGQSGVRLRVAFGSDGSVNSYNGVAFDDILIYDTPANDVGTSAITAPKGGDCGDDSTAVFVVLINSGLNPQTNFPVTVTYNNGAGSAGSISTTYTASILPNGTDTIFVGTFNSLVGGLYNFVTYTSLTNDGLHINDTTRASVFINAIPASPLAADVYKCQPDSFMLGVSPVLAGMHYTWFDSISGGSILESGPTFGTPFLSQNTTYYVGVQGNAQYQIPTSLAGSLTSTTNYTASGLSFTTDYPMTLDSVSIIPTGPGTIQLVVQDPTGVVIGTGVSYTVSVASGNTSLIRIPVGIVLPAGGSYQLLAAAGSTVPSLRYHFNGANYPYTAASVSITGATTGSTTAYFFFYNWKLTTYGCPSLRTPVIAGIYPTPVVSLGPDMSICGGDSLYGGNWVTTVWSRDNAVLGNAPTVYADATGTYSLVVTDTNGCVGMDELLLIVNPQPVVELGPDTTACGSVLIDAGNPGAFFAWTCNAIPTFSQTLTMVISGNYCVAVTNQFGCQTIDTIGVTIKPLPIVTLGTDLVTCSPAPLAALFPVANTTCLWTLPGGQTDTSCITTATSSGAYLLQMTDTVSGCTGSDELLVTFQAPPVVNIGGGNADTVCNSVVLDAGNPGAQYLWSLPGGGTATSKTVNATATGQYLVSVTNGIGCKATDSAQITINVKPAITSITPTSTKPYEYSYTVTSTGLNATYSWTFTGTTGATFTGNGSTVLISYPQVPDFYEVKVIATNECGTDSLLDVFLINTVEATAALAVTLSPNPTDGPMHIQVPGMAGPGTLMVSDVMGRVLLSQPVAAPAGNAGFSLDLSGWAKGTYLLHIRTAQGNATRKVVLY